MLKKAIILAGGTGTRMRPLTFAVPKPLLPVGDHTILEVCIAWLRNNGIKDIALSLGWRGNVIESYMGDGKQLGVNLHMVKEEEKLGTAGALHTLLKDWIGADDVFITNGDILTRINLDEFYSHHKLRQNELTVATKLNVTQSRFGVIRHVGRGIVIEEKPKYNELISTGMYIASPEAISMIPVYQQFDIPEWINRCQHEITAPLNTGVYPFEEPWVALENPEELEAVNQDPTWLNWIESNMAVSHALS